MNMKKKNRILLTALALTLSLVLCVSFIYAENTDTTADPQADPSADTEYVGSDLPVSESYVLKALRALEDKLTQKIDALYEVIGSKTPMDPPATDGVDTDVPPADTTEPPADTEVPPVDTDAPPTDTEPEETPTAPVSMTYTAIRLTKGQSIVGNCELILRSGTATALCPGVNGLSDLTAGADLANGTEITPNHQLLVPRDDGRGLTVTSEEAYVMVRGPYVISE